MPHNKRKNIKGSKTLISPLNLKNKNAKMNHYSRGKDECTAEDKQNKVLAKILKSPCTPSPDKKRKSGILNQLKSDFSPTYVNFNEQTSKRVLAKRDRYRDLQQQQQQEEKGERQNKVSPTNATITDGRKNIITLFNDNNKQQKPTITSSSGTIKKLNQSNTNNDIHDEKVVENNKIISPKNNTIEHYNIISDDNISSGGTTGRFISKDRIISKKNPFVLIEKSPIISKQIMNCKILQDSISDSSSSLILNNYEDLPSKILKSPSTRSLSFSSPNENNNCFNGHVSSEKENFTKIITKKDEENEKNPIEEVIKCNGLLKHNSNELKINATEIPLSPKQFDSIIEVIDKKDGHKEKIFETENLKDQDLLASTKSIKTLGIRKTRYKNPPNMLNSLSKNGIATNCNDEKSENSEKMQTDKNHINLRLKTDTVTFRKCLNFDKEKNTNIVEKSSSDNTVLNFCKNNESQMSNEKNKNVSSKRPASLSPTAVSNQNIKRSRSEVICPTIEKQITGVNSIKLKNGETIQKTVANVEENEKIMENCKSSSSMETSSLKTKISTDKSMCNNENSTKENLKVIGSPKQKLMKSTNGIVKNEKDSKLQRHASTRDFSETLKKQSSKCLSVSEQSLYSLRVNGNQKDEKDNLLNLKKYQEKDIEFENHQIHLKTPSKVSKNISKITLKDVQTEISNVNIKRENFLSVNEETDFELLIPEHQCIDLEKNVTEMNIEDKRTKKSLSSPKNAKHTLSLSKSPNKVSNSLKISQIISPSKNCNQDMIVEENFKISQENSTAMEQSSLEKDLLPISDTKFSDHEQNSLLIHHLQLYRQQQNHRSPSSNSVSVDSARGSSIDIEMDLEIVPGGLFWARLSSFPFWPCIVWPDEDGRTLSITNHAKQPVKVHVRFFADNGRRGLVSKSNMIPFRGLEDFEIFCDEYVRKYNKYLAKSRGYIKPKQPLQLIAVEEAEKMKSIPFEDRFKVYEQLLKESCSKLIDIKKQKKCSRRSTSSKTLDSETILWEQIIPTSTPTTLSPNLHNGKHLLKHFRSPTPESPAYESLDDLPMFVQKTKFAGKLLTTTLGMDNCTSNCINVTRKSSDYDGANSVGENNVVSQQTMEMMRLMTTSADMFKEQEYKNFHEFLKHCILGDEKKIDKSLSSLYEEEFNNHVQNLWLIRKANIHNVSLSMVKNIFSINYKSARKMSNRMKLLSQRILGVPVDELRNQLMDKKPLTEPSEKFEITCSTVAHPVSRDIDTVLDDILELPRDYLFEDLNREHICKVCRKPSNLIKCSGVCEMHIHKSCCLEQNKTLIHVTGDAEEMNALNSSSKTEEEIICFDCKTGKEPSCFVCRKNNEEKGILLKCSTACCNKYYHSECLKCWPQTRITRSASKVENLLCPRHVCHMCASDDPRGKFYNEPRQKYVRCIECPATYHMDSLCVPAGSYFYTALDIVCPRHLKSHQNRIKGDWCFICSKGGSLIVCDICPNAFHKECLKLSHNPDDYICEECETGRMLLYGEIVWAKCGSHKWWPGIIIPPPEIPLNILERKHETNEFVVRFFAANNHAWLSRGRTFLFCEGDWDEALSTTEKTLLRALQEAKRVYYLYEEKKAKLNYKCDRNKNLGPPPYERIKTNRPISTVSLKPNNKTKCACDCNYNGTDPCGISSKCWNRILYIECDPKRCPAGKNCQNQMFEKRVYPKLKIFRTQERGWGLLALEEIKFNSFVIEYVGEIIDDAEFRRRIAQKQEDRDENYYFLQLTKDYKIDAGPKGNLARFINHSCDPNLQTQIWSVNGLPRVGLFAIKDIPENTELTFNYNLECIGNELKMCHCGAKNCTGFIGTKNKESITSTETDNLSKKRISTETKSPVQAKKRKIKKNSEEQQTNKPKLTKRGRKTKITKINK